MGAMTKIGAEAQARAVAMLAMTDEFRGHLRAAREAGDDFRWAEARDRLRLAEGVIGRLEEAEREWTEWGEKETDRILGRTAGGEARGGRM